MIYFEKLLSKIQLLFFSPCRYTQMSARSYFFEYCADNKMFFFGNLITAFSTNIFLFYVFGVIISKSKL